MVPSEIQAEVRLNALESLLISLLTIVLNRVAPEDRTDLVKKLYEAKAEGGDEDDPKAEAVRRLTRAYATALIDRALGVPLDVEGVVHRQRPS